MKRIGIALVVVLSAACAGKKSSSDGPGVHFTSTAVNIDTGKFQVPAGESLTCIYTNGITDKEYSISNATGTQSPGGHHITVYYTPSIQTPDIHPCKDSEMLSWNFLAGAGNETGNTQFLPPGLGLKVPAGMQIVLQSHYINATADAEIVDDTMTLNVVDASQITAYAGTFVVNNDSFSIPANSPYESTKTCTVPQDFQIGTLLGHEHTSGTHFRLEQLGTGSSGGPTILYETDWQPSFMSHPPVILYPTSAPLLISSTYQLRITCDWDNQSADVLTFPTEMCIAFMYYWPDVGGGQIFCQ